MPATTVLTLSFAGDLEACTLLCETADRFVPSEIEHVVAVPRADLALFKPLANARRRVIPLEEVLPPWLIRLPLPGPAWRRRLHLPRRDVYLSLRGRPVRGWIAQQIMKLNAAAALSTDIVLHCDSDTAFIRPLRAGDLGDGGLGGNGRVRLLRRPGEGETAMHAPWHEAASDLLGLPPSTYHGADYIESFVTWRPAIVRLLLARVAEVSGTEAAAALARHPHFSEYILYGVFCDRVLGLGEAGHAATPSSLCAMAWSELAAGSGVPPIGPEHAGMGIQSTIPVGIATRRSIVEAAIGRAAEGEG